MPRHTARGIVIKDGQILLMERWRDQSHYFSIPGGGVEASETAEAAASREILEETTVVVSVRRQVLEMRDGEVSHQIFLCEYISGEPLLEAHAEEALRATEHNRFQPRWVAFEELANLPFSYWQPLKQPLLDGLATSFSDPLVVVTADQAR